MYIIACSVCEYRYLSQSLASVHMYCVFLLKSLECAPRPPRELKNFHRNVNHQLFQVVYSPQQKSSAFGEEDDEGTMHLAFCRATATFLGPILRARDIQFAVVHKSWKFQEKVVQRKR